MSRRFPIQRRQVLRANQSPGLSPGLVCWPPVCFDQQTICQLRDYLWHATCCPQHKSQITIWLIKWQTRNIWNLPFWYVMSLTCFTEHVGQKLCLAIRETDSDDYYVWSISAITASRETMKTEQVVRTVYFQNSSLSALSEMIWHLFITLPTLPRPWFRGFSSDWPDWPEIFRTHGYFLNGRKCNE